MLAYWFGQRLSAPLYPRGGVRGCRAEKDEGRPTEEDFCEAMLIEADGHAIWEAEAYLLSLPAYPLLFEKARPIGNMFHLTMVPILAQCSRLG
jgi:hypothetical protein